MWWKVNTEVFTFRGSVGVVMASVRKRLLRRSEWYKDGGGWCNIGGAMRERRYDVFGVILVTLAL